MAISLSVTTPSSPQVDEVQVDYEIDDTLVGTKTLTFRYKIGVGGAWNVCTESANPISDGLTPYHASPGPLNYSFVWDADVDLPLISADLYIEVTVDNGVDPVETDVVGPFGHYNSVLSGAPYTWLGAFAANNTAPAGEFVFPNPSTSPSAVVIAAQSGTMLIDYLAADADSDPVDVEFEYTRDGGKTWKTCVMGTGGDGNTGLTTTPVPGTSHTFAWDTSDLKSAYVQLRGKLTDAYADSAYFYSESFWIENKDSETWWVPKQVPPIIYKLDPDGVIQYWADLTEAWRIREATDILGFEELFNPDLCPQEYLPHLASRIGLRLNQNFPETVRRRQIRQALTWYKSKGLAESIDQRFAGIGYEARVEELWTDGFSCSETAPTNPCTPGEWMPHSRVNLYTLLYDLNSPVAPADFAELQRHFNEVRPIHVLVTELVTGVLEIDLYPPPDDENGLVDMDISPVSTVYPSYLMLPGAVVDLGGAPNQVVLPAPGNQFYVGEQAVIEGTANYDGTHTIVAKSPTTVTIESPFAAETLGGTETIKLLVTTLPLNYQHQPHDRLDEDSWLRHPGPGLSYFNGTRQAGTYGGGLIPSYGFNRDPFSDEAHNYSYKPEIGPPFRDIVTMGAGTGASWSYGDGSSYYEEDVGEIVAYDLGGNPTPLPGYPTMPIIV